MCIFASVMHNKARIILILLFLLPALLMAKGKRQVWVIDAGHGGRDVGCEGTHNKEKYITLSVAKRVAELVRANIPGVKVVMTRNNDTFVSLEQRANIANNADADLFLSIHVNAAPESNNVRGTETYYGPIGATSIADVEAARKKHIQKSELLAWEMQKYYGLAGRPISRGVKRERYYVILYTKMPSALTEIGFISTASEQEYMSSAKGQEEIAQSIYRGLKEYNETVQKGREKSVLAEMRRTGGRAAGAVQPADTDAKTPATDAKSTSDAKNPDMAVNVDAAAEAAAVLDPNLEPELETGELSFAIQIFSLKAKLDDGDKRFRGLKNIKIVQKDALYKYLYGCTSDYAVARKTLLEVRKVFPDAFLVAFLGNRQISTADAQEMYINKK